MILIWLEASDRPYCEKTVFAVSDTNWTVQQQMMARGLKFEYRK